MWIRFKKSGGQKAGHTASVVLEYGPKQAGCQRCQSTDKELSWFKGLRLCSICRRDLS